jgi:hypothetical protein
MTSSEKKIQRLSEICKCVCSFVTNARFLNKSLCSPIQSNSRLKKKKKRSFLIRLINQLQHNHQTSCQTPGVFLNSQTSKLADNKSSVTITVRTKVLIPVYRLQLRSPLRSAIPACLESQFFEDTIGTTFRTLQLRQFQASQKIRQRGQEGKVLYLETTTSHVLQRTALLTIFPRFRQITAYFPKTSEVEACPC